MAAAVTIAMATIFLMTSLSAMLIVAAVSVTAVLRGINRVVPVVLHEIDGGAAGVVLSAMLAPMLGMAGRYMQIHWLPYGLHGLNNDRLAIDQRWSWILIADINLAVEAWLTNADGNANIGSESRAC